MAKKTKKPIDMSALFQSSGGTLAQIASKTNSLTLLADIVSEICPDLPADVWHIANFRQNILVIEVNSSIWSQRLQFERMNISRALSEATQGQMNQIEIKVAPYRNKTQVNVQNPPLNDAKNLTPQKTNNKISQQTAEQLEDLAKSAPPALQKTLQRLAAGAKK